MCKLGLALGPQVESEDVDRYLQAFKDGLLTEQVSSLKNMQVVWQTHLSLRRWR
jgi:hypothetical protein